MLFSPPLQQAILIKRYKRFLADVILPNGEEVTMHVANTGAMTGCAITNDTVWYSTSTNLKRKYPYSWELTQTNDGHFICVNTMKANQLAQEAIENQLITPLSGYQTLTREVKYGEENSKIDLLLSSKDTNNIETNCFVEVKSVTLYKGYGRGEFPDAVTTRGQKHLRELMTIKTQGHRAVLLFVVLHSAIQSVSPAIDVDPVYAALLKQAIDEGVEVMAYGCEMSSEELVIKQQLPVLI